MVSIKKRMLAIVQSREERNRIGINMGLTLVEGELLEDKNIITIMI